AVQRHLHSQEASRSDAIFAEIVYLLDAGVGDLVARPGLRDFEIPLRVGLGAVLKGQISVADLLVSVVGDRVVLRSATLGREVVPCLASALNPRVGQNLALYRFLCSLVAQRCTRAHTADLWGALSLLPFLPRLVSGPIILALAPWRIGDQEVQALDLKSTVARFRAVQEWRAQRLLPRWVTLTETDNKLVVDLDNVLCIEGLIRLLKQQGGGTLEELFPPPDQTCVSGPEGHFAHELVVPFVRNDAAKRVVRSSGPRSAAMVPVRFPPGSEWLYVKLYLARGAADPILRAAIGPVARQLVATGLVDRWFFVRYQDPDFHLRIRFHGEPRRLLSDTLPALSSALAGVCASGALRRTQLDSYEPEVDRYGGLRGMAIAEEVFTLDSEA